MTRIAILGATGSLGTHLLRQAVQAGHEVTAIVRTAGKLPPELLPRITVHAVDLMTENLPMLTALLAGHDAVVNAAGFVTDGQVFVNLVDRVATALEALPAGERPVAWFVGGAAALQIGDTGVRGVDLRRIAATYWPHGANHARLKLSGLDWRLLCPGPMVDRPAIGLAHMRTALDRLPVAVPGFARVLPPPLLLPFFARWIPQMIVPYADAAALILSNVAPGGGMSRHRVGLALPEGQRGYKEHWVARKKAA